MVQDDTLDVEQHLIDISEEVKEAVVVLSQGIADLADKLAGTGKLEEVLSAIGKQLAQAVKSDSAKPIADAIVQGLKGLTIQAPDVTVHFAAPAIHLPEHPAPTVNIHGAKKWKHTITYNQHGQVADMTSERIA